MKNTKTLTFAVCITLLTLQGCSSLQRHSASGPVTLTDQSEPTAVIYWDQQIGRTWYGARLPSNPSPVNLRVCKDGMTVKRFTPTEPDQFLIVKGRSGDAINHTVNEQGDLIPTQEAIAGNGQSCMQLWQQGDPVTLSGLTSGATPSLLVVCKSTRSNRYPEIGKYLLGAVSKQTIDEENMPDVCQ